MNKKYDEYDEKYDEWWITIIAFSKSISSLIQLRWELANLKELLKLKFKEKSEISKNRASKSVGIIKQSNRGVLGLSKEGKRERMAIIIYKDIMVDNFLE